MFKLQRISMSMTFNCSGELAYSPLVRWFVRSSKMNANEYFTDWFKFLELKDRIGLF